MENKNWALPASIIIAGLIIAGAVFYVKKDNSAPGPEAGQETPEEEIPEINGPKEITAEDHVLGNPDAPLTFVLFSDLECYFCKTFNDATNQMMDEYGKDGKVKLVFRHFPLDSRHPKARKEAEASECAADIGGPEKFWKYIDRVFEITPSNDGLDPKELPKIAEYIGVNKTKFTECLDSGKFADKVQENYDDAIASGAEGTPFFIIINQKGEKTPLNGALSYQELKLILDQALGQQ